MTNIQAETVKANDSLIAVNSNTLNDDHFKVVTVSKSRVTLRQSNGNKINIHKATLKEYFYVNETK